MAYTTAGAASLITQAGREILDIPLGDAENDEWRDRCLSALRRVVKKVWEYPDAHPWDFVVGRATLALPAATGTTDADAVVVAPARFRRLGPGGSMRIVGQRAQVFYKDPADLFALRELDLQRGGYPRRFTAHGLDTATGRPFLYFWPFPTNASSLYVKYEFTEPTITDADPGGLEYLPVEWRESILLVGMEDLLAAKTGDARSASQWSPRFLEALNDAYTARLHGIEEPRGVGRRGVGLYRQH